MILSKGDILKRYKKDALKIAFIGMSNIGKTYTAKRLADAYDFTLVDIDNNIQHLLGKESMDDFAAWQGQPYEAGYKTREAESIKLETEVTLAAINTAKGNTILDTAGSIIYTGERTLEALKRDFFIVHIKADDADIERLKTIYYEQPKPLVWAEHYVEASDMTPEENITACYPNLLKARAALYGELADMTLNSKIIFEEHFTPKAIFECLGG